MNVTEQVCEHVVGTRFEDLTPESIARAKTRLIDSLGVITAGANAPGCEAMLDVLKRAGGTPEVGVFAHDLKLPLESAAMMNSLMMRSFDFEAIEAEGEGHTSCAAHISGTTVPVALATAEYRRASGKDLLLALILGDDIASRLGASSGFDVYSGWDNTGTQNGLGATVIAAKLLGLDEEQMLNALGIVENQLSGVIDNINDKTLAFKLPMAVTARNAIFSAMLAKNGFTAMRDAIGGAHGFFKVYCGDPKPEQFVKDLGKVYYADVVIKPYSACRATHPSITACEDLVAAHEFDVADIERVVIKATPRTCKGFVGQPFEIGATPQVSGAFSILYTAADMLLRKSVFPAHFTEEMMREPAICELLGKISLVPELPADEYQTSEVEVYLNDGTRYHQRCDVPKGDIYKNPISNDRILEKYRANLAFTGRISQTDADRALAMVDSLETLDDVSELLALFA